MNTQVLSISPKGQITLPVEWRKEWLALGNKAKVLAWRKNEKPPIIVLSPKPASWSKMVAGIGKGLWGNPDEYVQKVRDEWK